MWTLRFVLQLAFAASVIGTHARTTKQLDGRQSDVSIVRGLSSRDDHGNAFLRREVSDLKENFPDQWNLYLLGLESLQGSDQQDPLSFYGLAAIHGRPYKVWGDAPGLSKKIGTSGYCPHNNILFLGWHRPYLALFEEVLVKHMLGIAQKAPQNQRERYVAAANSFRMPYWDWARGDASGPVPEFFVSTLIDVTRPDGSNSSIWNPLHSYQFHPVIPNDFETKWMYINATVRWPETDKPSDPSRQDRFVQEFVSQRRSLRDHVDQAFRRNDINGFATVLEEAHGWMHGVIGGGWDNRSARGHFWPLEYSAFEPLFMLHHTNVDRLFAMYQAAHPDIFFRPENIDNNGNVYLENGDTAGADTELLPFRKSSGGFWTTKDARYTETLGYTYPETQKSGQASGNGTQIAASAAIATLYSASAKDILTTQQGTDSPIRPLLHNNTFADWMISTKAITSKLPSTFIVRFRFSGKAQSDAPIDVGSWMKLMPSNHETNPSKRAAESGKMAESSISITSDLLDRVAAGELLSLEEADVVPFLKERLSWKALSGNGTELSQESLGAFTFEVVSTDAHIPKDATRAIEYSGAVAKHSEVTMGKAGGVESQSLALL